MLTPAAIWPAPPPAALPADHVHVWHAPLDLAPPVQATVAAWLNPAEQARAARFHFDHHRAHFIAGRGLLRLLLGYYLNREPAAITLTYSDYDKPYLPGAELHFNLSHSGGRAVFAFARDRVLGVDVEQVRELPDAEAIARRFFAAGEVARFLALPAVDRPVGFFNCWTRKEAFIKAVGEGLSYPLDIFEVTLTPGEPARLRHVQGSAAAAAGWQLQVLEPGVGYAAALVVAGAEPINLSEANVTAGP